MSKHSAMVSAVLAGVVALGMAITQASAAKSDHELRPNPRNFAAVTKGARLFQKNCAVCHGKLAEGAPNWRIPDENGKFRPPPLNGGGHMWHHPLPVLLSTIRNGTLSQGGSMPAWKGTLTDRDIMDIISWLQSKWPREIYQQWQKMDARAQARR
ncbi:MAG: hypothetical protein Kow006_31170 [Gammaproteobacteria bacterium]